jgi:hypothetical protein
LRVHSTHGLTMTTRAVDLRVPSGERSPSDHWRSRPRSFREEDLSSEESELPPRLVHIAQKDVGLLVDPEVARVAVAAGSDWCIPGSSLPKPRPPPPPAAVAETEEQQEHQAEEEGVRQLLAMPSEIVSLILAEVDDSRDMLACRASCVTLRRLATADELWRQRVQAIACGGPAYSGHVNALLRDDEFPAYQCFWIASRIACAPSEAKVRAEFEARSMPGDSETIRSHHVSALLGNLFGKDAVTEEDTLDLVMELDEEGMGWITVTDFLEWLVTDDCWLLDRDQGGLRRVN